MGRCDVALTGSLCFIIILRCRFGCEAVRSSVGLLTLLDGDGVLMAFGGHLCFLFWRYTWLVACLPAYLHGEAYRSIWLPLPI